MFWITCNETECILQHSSADYIEWTLNHDQAISLTVMREGLGDQVGEKVTPQSQKSYNQVASENIFGIVDKVASTTQLSDSKLTTQMIGDSTRSSADDAQGTYLDSAKEITSGVGQTVQDALDAAKDSTKDKRL
ncbi:hypothetical protein B0O99DRAFT_670295 [Bisporella sp. PMI_857]|nr:hypothetical protein B0O99DRAFT_670295 [Bisporella sp. PMI_857]